MRENFVNDVRLIQGNFIIATPLLLDPLFEKSIIFMSEFKEGSAYGFLVDYSLQDSSLLQDVRAQIDSSLLSKSEVFLGGPMDPDHHFLIHSNDVFGKKTLQISDDVSITNLSDALKNFSYAPSFYKIFAGYCYWKIGQLECEIKKGLWLVKAFSNNLLYTRSKQKWKQSIESLNMNFKKFALSSGVA